jgi:hypothetical protein
MDIYGDGPEPTQINAEFKVDQTFLTEWDKPVPSFLVPKTPAPWPNRLSFDVAMGTYDEKQLCDAYEITIEDFDRLRCYPPFRREVVEHKQNIKETGVTFKTKAKMQAEEYLDNLDALILGIDTPPSVKLAAIQSVVKWAGLEPKPETVTQQGGGPSVTINITRFSNRSDEAITIE